MNRPTAWRCLICGDTIQQSIRSAAYRMHVQRHVKEGIIRREKLTLHMLDGLEVETYLSTVNREEVEVDG